MLIAAIILFIIAALFGLIILTAVLQDRPGHKMVVYLHGIIAATALILVIIYMILNVASPTLTVGLTLLILGALGGLTLFIIDMKGGTIPKWVAVLHPLIAVTGLVALIIYVLP
ncbi:hypothetical protein [Legionella maioricensis]|uniref:Uncharacterized protein n=1 Tax=Legionella maioricensis TaxID=2896528 RepID=A0A9X2CYD5_9GAMM|nr:hypothetical protein [Legionella maioricensis]MCL9683026.1 hypothetical protein [Legionella maioricensis]MCL9686374.1 hypothetical protein [Legionella maioricensis]